MMHIGVVGGRDCDNYEFVRENLLHVIREELGIDDLVDVVIVSGGARGADSLAQRFAKEFGLTIVIHYPDWDRFGKKAGIVRNFKIVRDSDVIVAFPTKNSRGTWHTVNIAKKAGKPVYVIKVN